MNSATSAHRRVVLCGLLLLIGNLPKTCGYGFGGFGYPGSSNAPWDANSTSWQRLAAASNATGKVSVQGYDVSLPWPGKPMDGWVLNRTILDGEFGSGVTLEFSSEEAIGEDIRLVAPKSLYKPSTGSDDGGRPVVHAHPDWAFCAWRFFGVDPGQTPANPDYLDAPSDGSCAQWMPKDCIEALEKWAQTAYYMTETANAPWGFRYQCDEIELPNECQNISSIAVEPSLGSMCIHEHFETLAH